MLEEDKMKNKKTRFAWQKVMNEQESYYSKYDEDHAYRMAQHLTLKDGTKLSIQASHAHCCTPRKTIRDYKAYTHFEIGFPSVKIQSLMEFAEDQEKPTDTVYGYVPKSIIDKIVRVRGGVVGHS